MLFCVIGFYLYFRLEFKKKLYRDLYTKCAHECIFLIGIILMLYL